MIWRRDLEDGELGDRNHPVVHRAAQCHWDGSVRHRLVVRRDILARLARQESRTVTAKTSSWAVRSLCCASHWQLPLRWLSITTPCCSSPSIGSLGYLPGLGRNRGPPPGHRSTQRIRSAPEALRAVSVRTADTVDGMLLRSTRTRRGRRILALVLAVVAIGLVVVEPFPKGDVLLPLTHTHGIDTGDIPALAMLIVAAALAV
jgi:hypothetical protein